MAKRNNKRSMAEDYLHQVEWENRNQVDQIGRAPWKDVPNWKYKRAFGVGQRRSKGSLFGETIWWIFMIATIGCLLFQIFSGHNGKGIFISILVLIPLGIPYFMLRETR
jgi:hypothetical protein